MKRIGLLIMKRHATTLGGIGFYVASFIDKMHGKNFVVDIITDQAFGKDDVAFEVMKKCKIISPTNQLAYTESAKMFTFEKQKTHPEIFVNSLRSVMKACHDHIYDLLFVNSLEMAPGLIHSGLHNIIPTVAYCHDGQFLTDYPDSLDDFGGIMDVSKQIPLVRQHELIQLHPDFKVTYPIPMPSLESEWFREIEPTPGIPPRAMFIGTWRDSKKPEQFVRFCKERQLNANIITSEGGVEKFKKAFEGSGLDVKVRTNISGEEKVRFIAECTIGFHPSSTEFYPYAVLEMLAYMPVLCFSNYRWTDRMGFHGLYKMTKWEDLIKVPLDTLQNSRSSILDYFDEEKHWNLWEDLIRKMKPLPVPSKSPSISLVAAHILVNKGMKVDRFWKGVYSTPEVNYSAIDIFYKIARWVGYSNSFESSYFGEVVEDVGDSSLESFMG